MASSSCHDDGDDPRIDLKNQLLEISIPEDEPQMFAAIRYNDIEMIERQLREGFDINFRKDDGDGSSLYRLKCPTMAHRVQTKGYAVLHVAVFHAEIKVIEMLLSKGANVNILDDQHRSPLHLAVVVERIPVIKLLLQRGADINLQSSSGRTPLLEAAINDSEKCMQVLINAGANLDLADIKGTSLLHQMCFARVPKMYFIELILKKGANINITNLKGATPLMFAVAMKNLKLVDMLVKNGANINQPDRHGRTAIHFVIEHKHKSTTGRMAILLYLIHHGACINTTDKSDMSLLSKAVRNMSLSAIKVLLLAECRRNSEKLLAEEQIVYLCDVVPGFRDWLLHELRTPKSLLRACRQTIRQCIHKDRLMDVCDLDLPRQLQDYLLVRDLRSEDF